MLSIDPKTEQEKTLLESLGTPILITNGQGRTTWMNTACVTLCGYTLEEMLGKKPGAVLQGSFTDPVVKRALSKKIAAREPVEVDILNYKKDRTPYWVNLKITPLYSEGGELERFICLAQDITQQREAERQAVKLLAAIAKVKIPEGYITQCAWNQTVRNHDGQFVPFAKWIEENTEARVSHGISPEMEDPFLISDM